MRRRHFAIVSLCSVIVILIAVVGILFWKYQQATNDPANKAKETSVRIIDKVSSLYMVPQGEEPTVAQIQDKDKLGKQEFFKSSQNGDYLLVYQKAKVAIVYRENVNKLVTVGPISVGDDQGQDPQGQTAGAQTEAGSETPAQ